MTDSEPPKLDPISQSSGFNVPTMSSLNSDSVQDAQQGLYGNAQSTVNAIQNHPATQSVKDTLSNGPVADHVKDQHAKTTSEFRNLADSRTTPEQSTATGQPLTHYHSFFYNLLSWENPRATTLSFISVVLFIFAARYLPALRWSFKVLWMVLGITASAEIAGKLVLSQGLASSFRPKKYYTIPREALEASLEDVEQLINFFVIEFQRVLFAENVVHTIAGFGASLLSYWLIKVVPFWGLSLIAVSCIYMGPLIYMTNKELIDHHVKNASEIANSQANQLKDLAGHHTSRAHETVKSYAGDYTAKAQEYIGNARGRSTSPEVASSKPTSKTPIKSEPGSGLTDADFPHAPKQEPTPGVTSHEEQYKNSQFGGQAEPAY
ncbi:Reticulon-domain-containing protein [Usnea florida]